MLVKNPCKVLRGVDIHPISNNHKKFNTDNQYVTTSKILGKKSALTIEEKFKSLSEEDFANLCVVARIMRNYKYSGKDIADKPTFKVDNLTISNLASG